MFIRANNFCNVLLLPRQIILTCTKLREIFKGPHISTPRRHKIDEIDVVAIERFVILLALACMLAYVIFWEHWSKRKLVKEAKVEATRRQLGSKDADDMPPFPLKAWSVGHKNYLRGGGEVGLL